MAQHMALRDDVVAVCVHNAACEGRVIEPAVVALTVVLDCDLPVASLCYRACIGNAQSLQVGHMLGQSVAR